ncbi:ParA family protein [Streptomyces jumonjinensis]|uniref:ParA family protein n=1 Tax=Streptomyces jumonjinensis TaxID=1945 RepID=UPI00332FBB8B
MTRRVAIGNNKGGARKTTLTIRLAEGLAKLGKRVLVVDLDPQGDTSRRLGWTDTLTEITTSEIIAANSEGVAAQAIQAIGWNAEYADRIAVIPARYTLEDRATEAKEPKAWRRLAKALKNADHHFDYTLIDCPPSLGHLTHMGLAAADYALATTEPEHDSVKAAVKYRDFIRENREDLGNPELELVGVVVSGYDQRIGAHKGQLDGARTRFGDLLWGVVPQRSTITNADEFARSFAEEKDSAEVRAVFELLAARLVKEIPA